MPVMARYTKVWGVLCEITLQWRHNGCKSISNHQPQDWCTDQRKHQSSASLAFVQGNSLVTSEFPAQMASNREIISIWWHHHDGLINILDLLSSCSKLFCLIYSVIRMFYSMSVTTVSGKHFIQSDVIFPSVSFQSFRVWFIILPGYNLKYKMIPQQTTKSPTQRSSGVDDNRASQTEWWADLSSNQNLLSLIFSWEDITQRKQILTSSKRDAAADLNITTVTSITFRCQFQTYRQMNKLQYFYEKCWNKTYENIILQALISLWSNKTSHFRVI